MTDPLHLDPLVARLAQEAWERANKESPLHADGPDAPSKQSSVLCRFTRELVAVVAEECAKVCEGVYVLHEDLPESEGYLYDAAAAIRAKFKA